MNPTLRLALLSIGLIINVNGEVAQAEEYFRVGCGQYKINPFDSFCRNGVRVPCDFSHCQQRLTEDSREGCALFCEQVLKKLHQLPQEIAERKVLLEEAALNQQLLNEQEKIVARLQAEKSKLLIQNITLGETITAQKERYDNLEVQEQAFMICTIILSALVVVVIPVLVFFLIRFKRNRKRSNEESEKLLERKESTKLAGAKSTTGVESTVDSAFHSTYSGSTKPSEGQEKMHKCEDFNKFKPTDDEEMAILVTNGTKLDDYTSKLVVEESS